MAIPNKFESIFDDLIDSSDRESPDQPESPNQPESPDWPGPIDKKTRNTPRSKGALPNLLEEDCLDEDVLLMLLELVPETQNPLVYKCYDIASFDLKNGRTQYGEGQKGEKDGKDKRGRENGKDERDKRGHCRNKKKPMVGESNRFEASVYYHITYWFH